MDCSYLFRDKIPQVCGVDTIDIKAKKELSDFATVDFFKIKPCPFCGKNPYTHLIEINDYNNVPRLHAEIECLECKIMKEVIIERKEATFINVLNTIKQVVEKWNTRSN